MESHQSMRIEIKDSRLRPSFFPSPAIHFPTDVVGRKRKKLSGMPARNGRKRRRGDLNFLHVLPSSLFLALNAKSSGKEREEEASQETVKAKKEEVRWG